MLNKLKKEIYSNKLYLILGYIISILTMLPQLYASPPLSPESNHLFFLLIVLILLFTLIQFSKILFGIFIIYLNLSNIIIGHIFIHWGYTDATIAPRIGVAVISPDSEMLEYLTTYIDYRDILLVFYSIVILIALYKYLTHFRHTFKVIKFIGFIVAIAIMIVVGSYKNPLLSQEPFSIPYECIQAINTSKLYAVRKEYLSDAKIEYNKNIKPIYDKVIIIQGESANKNHMAVYGYNKNTTPFFSSLKLKDNFVAFNAISPANLTHFSVPILHTKANVHDFVEEFTHSVSALTKFKSLGYKTYWISNQGQAGVTDTNIASMAEEADIVHYEIIDYMNAKPDEIMMNYIKNIKNNNDKEMYFIHLTGSHVKYIKRYTPNHVLFKKASTIIKQYDNTIYYTDYILETLFNYFLHQFPTKKLLFIYISDHGEVVSEEKHGHGFFPPYKDEFDVPFIIYSNIQNNRLKELYQLNNKHTFNLENLNYIVSYLSGITNESNISYSNYVFAADPHNVFDYSQLKPYESDLK